MQHKPPERYTSLRELGRGAIGTVYAARDRSTGTVVALKSLDPALVSAADPNLAELFLNNARAATRLRHRNIVQVHDAGEAGGAPYVAMELLEGESLRKILDDGPLPIARAIRIFDDIASALAYAHEEKIVHRGVRPSNITVLPSGVAKIADFGIGQIGEAALRYKSPEQVRGG
jgi:eukaryotic-like serine/threonine-protein kinase